MFLLASHNTFSARYVSSCRTSVKTRKHQCPFWCRSDLWLGDTKSGDLLTTPSPLWNKTWKVHSGKRMWEEDRPHPMSLQNVFWGNPWRSSDGSNLWMGVVSCWLRWLFQDHPGHCLSKSGLGASYGLGIFQSPIQITGASRTFYLFLQMTVGVFTEELCLGSDSFTINSVK